MLLVSERLHFPSMLSVFKESRRLPLGGHRCWQASSNLWLENFKQIYLFITCGSNFSWGFILFIQKGEEVCCFLLRSCQSVDDEFSSLVPFSPVICFSCLICKLTRERKRIQIFFYVCCLSNSFTKTPCVVCTFLFFLLSSVCTQPSREDGNNISWTVYKVHAGELSQTNLKENLRGRSRRSNYERGFTR